jgi:hypothetical protein
MRPAMRISAVSLVAAGMLLAANALADSKGKDEHNIRVNLKGFEEAPVTVTGASGELRLAINEAAGSIAYELTYQDLEGTVTQSHIHVGQKNVAGGIAIWLCQTAGTPAPAAVAAITPSCPGPHSGTVSGTATAANVIGPTGQAVPAGALADVLTAIRAGKAYGNVHSTSAPGGEIRGQLD